MINRKLGWMGKGVVLFLSALLIALPALAQSTTEQEQSPKVQSNTIQGQLAKTLSDAERGALDGERDGGKNTHALTWLIGGFVGGPVTTLIAGLIGTNFYPPEIGCYFGVSAGIAMGIVSAIVPMTKPTPSSYVGKSAEYIDSYNDAFKKKVRKKQSYNYWLSYIISNGLFFCCLFSLGTMD